MNVRHIRISQVRPKGPAITVLAGDGVATPSGDGGWQSTARPRRKGFVEFVGTSLIAMDVPIVLDGWSDSNRGRSVEPDLRVLESMLRKRQGAYDEPPVITIEGATVPHRQLNWVIATLTYGDMIRRESDGARVRQNLTLSVIEYVAPDVLGSKPSAPKRAKERNKGGGKKASGESWSASSRSVTARHGDTLQKIAVRAYGDRSRWHDIAHLNGIRDPKALKVGQRVFLP